MESLKTRLNFLTGPCTSLFKATLFFTMEEGKGAKESRRRERGKNGLIEEGKDFHEARIKSYIMIWQGKLLNDERRYEDINVLFPIYFSPLSFHHHCRYYHYYYHRHRHRHHHHHVHQRKKRKNTPTVPNQCSCTIFLFIPSSILPTPPFFLSLSPCLFLTKLISQT